MNKSYNRALFLLFGGFFVLLTLLLSLFYFESNQKDKKEDWVRHTQSVIYTAETLLSKLKDAETGQRGFLLAEDSSFLNPYLTAKESINFNLVLLNQRTADNPIQQKIVEKLRNVIDKRLHLLNINLRYAKKIKDQQFKENLTRGRIEMDSIRLLIDQLLLNEKTLLIKRSDEYERYKLIADRLLIAIYGTFFIFFGICYHYAQRLISKQREYEFTLFNNNLELHSFNEELDALNEELKSANEEISATNEELTASNEELHEANQIIQIQSDKLIQHTEEKLKDVLDSINEIVLSINISTQNIQFLNSASLSILGHHPEDFIQDPNLFFKLVHPNDLDSLKEEFDAVLNKGLNEIEFRIIHPNGKTIWMSAKLIVKNDNNEQPIRVDAILRDITKKKEALEQLKASESKYKYIFDHNPLPFFVLDLISKRFLDVNNAALEMYGYEKQEFISLSASSLGFIHEDKNEYDNLKNGIFDNVLQHAIFTNIKKDGTRFLTEFYSERCVYNNREARIALCFDITERKQIEKEKELLTNELIEKNNDLEEFAYVISHNLRSPVANILGLINVINLPQSSKEDIDFALRKLQVAGNTLDKIVRDMNEILSKRDDKTGQKIKSTIDVETEIQDILGSIENMIVSSKATIHCEFHLAPTIITFHPYFHNITINLITNALKYHNPERKSIISIKTYPQDNFICLNIKDNGLGMDMDLAQNKIFKLYNRFHLHIEGKGIGLYLVRNQIHAMGGKIEVKSKLNEGSEFTVYFPHVPSLSLN